MIVFRCCCCFAYKWQSKIIREARSLLHVQQSIFITTKKKKKRKCKEICFKRKRCKKKVFFFKVFVCCRFRLFLNFIFRCGRHAEKKDKSRQGYRIHRLPFLPSTTTTAHEKLVSSSTRVSPLGSLSLHSSGFSCWIPLRSITTHGRSFFL